MKKYFIVAGTIFGALVLSNCNPSKKLATEPPPPPPPKMTYATNLSTVIMNNCVPCHIPAKGGRKENYDNYANVKKDIDNMIRRIQLNPTDKGFMPFKGTARLSDSVIAVFKQWKDDGMLEN